MEQKIDRISKWQQLRNLKAYQPDWDKKPIIELFNPNLGEGTYYLTKHDYQDYCVFYQVRNPLNEKNQQLWVESIQFSLTDEKVKVREQKEYRLIVKGEHSFSWGTYQEHQSHFHLNITHRADKRIFGSLIDLIANTPCKNAAPPNLYYNRRSKDYDTNVTYHYLDYTQITSSEAKHDSFLDLIGPEVGLNIGRRLDQFALAQAQSVSKQWFNFFHEKPFGAPGYYPHWGERVFYELFNPKLKEGTYYFTRVDNEYRLYIQKRNQDLGYNKTVWVECQHFTVKNRAIYVTQLDELRLIYDHDGCSYNFDSFLDDGRGSEKVGISSKYLNINYNSLETYLQQFLSENAAPKNLRLKRTELREPRYLKIASVCDEYDLSCSYK